jgi:hypothetical protein
MRRVGRVGFDLGLMVLNIGLALRLADTDHPLGAIVFGIGAAASLWAAIRNLREAKRARP